MNSKLLVRRSKFNKRQKQQSFALYRRLLLLLLREHKSDFGTLYDAVEASDWDTVLALADSLASAKYSSAMQHYVANQFSALIRKYPFPKGSVTTDPRKKATETFLASEHRCKRVNQRFAAYDKVRCPVESELSTARNWIRYVLGDDLPLDVLWDKCGFGPGASVGITGNSTNFGRKLLAQKWTVTPGAFYYARACFMADDHLLELLNRVEGSPYHDTDPLVFKERFSARCRIVDNNKITFVAKTARTERTIAVEPLLNGYLQKGVDNFMRDRLLRVGIDLRDQTRNSVAAYRGSTDTSESGYVTIDLSSASDSVSIGLVRNLLPPEWFDLMNSLRSCNYSLNGGIHRYEKFVTMGNGFCFPLETLIFASLCTSVYRSLGIRPDFLVYGDDIIVQKRCAGPLLSLLKVCGFRANLDKTFLEGPFRESCGADWYQGVDVRPMTLDYALDSLESMIKFCNIVGYKESWKAFFISAKDFIFEQIPPQLRFVRPYTGSDEGAVEVPIDIFMASPFAKWDRKIQSWSWSELVKRPKVDTELLGVAGYNVALIWGLVRGAKNTSNETAKISASSPYTIRRETTTKICRLAYSGAVNNWKPGDSGSWFYLNHFSAFV